MRVVLTCNHSPWSRYSGGGQRSTHNLAGALSARGHEVTVVFTKPPHVSPTVPSDLPYRLRWASLWDPQERRNAPLRPLTALTVARTVRALLVEGAQVVHTNGEEGAMLPALKRRHRFALVATPRYPSLPGSLLDGTTSRLGRAKLAITDPKYLTLGWALRGADAVSPPSHYAAALMARAYHLRAHQLHPVHNGVPAEFLDHRFEPHPSKEQELLFFGRFAEDKGIDTLVEALTRLGARAPRTKIVGRGPLRSHVLEQIQKRGLGQRVTVLDWMSHHELGAALCQATMAALPSREENFSLAVLSAMAVGTPLIATPVGGTGEVMDDGETGLLVPPGDAKALATAVQRYLDAPAWASSLGDVARNRVRSSFTWDITAKRFESLYDRILAGEMLGG